MDPYGVLFVDFFGAFWSSFLFLKPWSNLKVHPKNVVTRGDLLLMAEILHHLACMKP